MTEEHSLKAILAERLRAADPTSLRSYKLLDLLFKIVQWTVFSGFMQAIGVKTSNRTFSFIGLLLLLLVVFFTWHATTHILDGIYRPGGFATKTDRRFAYAISAVVLAVTLSFFGLQLLNAAMHVSDYYLGK